MGKKTKIILHPNKLTLNVSFFLASLRTLLDFAILSGFSVFDSLHTYQRLFYST